MQPANGPLVSTIKERCRMCYTCVRECPAKAIRVANLQAEVIPDRCIGCGHCVQVCSQGAKKVASDLEYVYALLRSPARVAAVVAPSFPAEFDDIDPDTLVGMLRATGFDMVVEVGFGADLVAAEYHELLAEHPDQRYIATTCPGLIGYVERYHLDLIETLAPIVSPMIATARALHHRHGKKLQIVFIGPCIAKKGEATCDPLLGEVNAVMTFIELRDLFAFTDLRPEAARPSNFDPPHAGFGGLFPISRGLLQAAEIEEDLLANNVVVVSGHNQLDDVMDAFRSGDLKSQLLECLCCEGCIMGPGLSTKTPIFQRRDRVSRYVRERTAALDRPKWKREVREFCDALDLTRTYVSSDQRIAAPSEDKIRGILARMGKHEPQDELNCCACGYDTCRAHATAIYKGLAESEMCLPYTIEQLRKAYQELTSSHDQLVSAREALRHSEKLASMGQLAAGIAHEVNNPLGTVLMMSHVLLEEAQAGDAGHEDLELIAREAGRCKKIVSGLLQFARKNKVEACTVNLRELIDRVVQTTIPTTNIEVKIEHADDDLTAEIDEAQITQVLTNLIANSIAATSNGGALTIRTWSNEDEVSFAVADSGTGIPPENLKRIFEPFFTTKKVGQGTGLGLAVTYGIVKMHHGDIRVKSSSDPAAGPTGTTFTVSLPRKRRGQEKNLTNNGGDAAARP